MSMRSRRITAGHWRAEARMRQAIAAAIESSAGLDSVRLENARLLRYEAANLLRMAAAAEQERPRKSR
jgi:hypothetical protein